MAKSTLTAERVRELLDYDPETGVFRWRVYRCGQARPGYIAGGITARGYWCITLDGVRLQAHRLAWYHYYGVWPAWQIDHRNEDKLDNRIANLREATTAQNVQNVTHAGSDNTNGYRGVKRNWKRWLARITVNGKETNLGTFDTPEEAHAAYLAAKAELHPFWTQRKNHPSLRGQEL